jgi:hypothetical protein
MPWEALFFESGSAHPFSRESAGPYAVPLDLLRLAPSSRNYQPWRVSKDGSSFHLSLKRTRGHGPGSLVFRLLSVCDLQRVDIGIAMCHFALTAKEPGIKGKWVVQEPAPQTPGEQTDHVVSWDGSVGN